METKVVHVHLVEPHKGKTDYYFGSIAAIYEVLSAEVVGIRYDSLTNTIGGKDEYANKKAFVRVARLVRKASAKKKAAAKQ